MKDEAKMAIPKTLYDGRRRINRISVTGTFELGTTDEPVGRVLGRQVASWDLRD